MPQKTAIIFGKGEVAIEATRSCIESGYSIPFVVPSANEPKWLSSFSDWAKEQGIKIQSFNHLNSKPKHTWTLGVSAGFDALFKSHHINQFEKMINLHNAPLPKFRGVLPINWALELEENQFGVTIHEITEGVDDGPILGQKLFNIDPADDEVEDVYSRCVEYGLELLIEVIPHAFSVTPIVQAHTEASYFGKSDAQNLVKRKYWNRSNLNLGSPRLSINFSKNQAKPAEVLSFP